jgi:hypothetical protein
MVEEGINGERREVGGREKKSNNGEGRGKRRGREGKGGRRGRGGVERWHQPQPAVALFHSKCYCYGT